MVTLIGVLLSIAAMVLREYLANKPTKKEKANEDMDKAISGNDVQNISTLLSARIDNKLQSKGSSNPRVKKPAGFK